MNHNSKYINILDFTLYLFVFSITFEFWNPFGLQGVFSITKMTGIIYILSWVPLFFLIKFDKLAIYFIPLIFYLFFEIFSSAVNNSHLSSVFNVINIKIIQMLFIAFLISTHIISNPKVIRRIENAFILSILILAILSLLNIGSEIYRDRLLMFGENPNMIGMKGVFSIIIIVSRIMEKRNTDNNKFTIIYYLVLIPISMLVISTGSRGALISIILGILFIFLSINVSILKKLILIIIGSIGTYYLVLYVFLSNELFRYRFDQLIIEGETGRNQIWLGSMEIIKNNLLFGVGRNGILPEMSDYIGREMGPHNVFLFIILSSGIIGFIFFMNFFFRLWRRLFNQFKNNKNPLYFVLFLILILNMSKAGGFFNKTFLWFFLAFLMGASLIDLKKIDG